ncbi:MAG: DNA-directed RNA polymerase subunit L [Candidatus Verstraetearchaeota archaeon]|nr:DNA-directed RNA polymerase subunit L [Candidatus Verstraetearchaeota archaeon]NHW44839.1 DNA-directed RNA polymerase subunit L [Candidatus Verstraetearchaeota archaeon]
MKVRILERGERSLKIEIIGEGHTFCNLLRDFLLRNPDVEFVAYRIDHPLVSNPVFYVRTKDGRPEEALRKAAEDMVVALEDFKKIFSSALDKQRASSP